MELSQRERDVIACTCFRADLPLTSIAKETGLRVQMVRTIVARLREKGVIHVRAFINPYAIGLHEYIAFINLQSPGEENRRKLIDAFCASSSTTYVAEIGGDSQISVMFVVRQLKELRSYFDSIASAVPGIQFEKRISPCLNFTQFPPKHLSSKKFSSGSISYSPVEKVYELDDLDRKILECLMRADAARKSEVSRTLGLPLATLDYRLKTLRDRGILLGVGHSIPVFADGMSSFALRLVLRRPDAEFDRLVFALAERHPSTTYILQGVDNWDYMLGIRIADPRAISPIAQEFRRVLDKYVSSIDVIPVYGTCKLVPYPLTRSVPNNCRKAVGT